MLLLLLAVLVVAEHQHPAAKHVGEWHTPPHACPSSMVSDCPLLGNGDMGVGLGGIAATADMSTINQTYYLGKMDFWTQQNMASALEPAPPPPRPTRESARGH